MDQTPQAENMENKAPVNEEVQEVKVGETAGQAESEYGNLDQSRIEFTHIMERLRFFFLYLSLKVVGTLLEKSTYYDESCYCDISFSITQFLISTIMITSFLFYKRKISSF